MTSKNPSRSLYSCAAVSMPPGVRPEVIPAVLLFGIFRVGMHHLIVKVPDAFCAAHCLIYHFIIKLSREKVVQL